MKTLSKEFIAYGTRQNGDKSGAYLFLPDGPAELLPVEKPYVRVIEGKLLSYVEVFLPHVKHVVTLKSSPGKYSNIFYTLTFRVELKINFAYSSTTLFKLFNVTS